jgi:hypothetical protein
MPYVQRCAKGCLGGLYARLQPGFAEEWKEDDDPEVIAYRAWMGNGGSGRFCYDPNNQPTYEGPGSGEVFGT